MLLDPVLSNPNSPRAPSAICRRIRTKAGSARPRAEAQVIAIGAQQGDRPVVEHRGGVRGRAGRGTRNRAEHFHHFADHNWDVRAGGPRFVTECPGDGLLRNPAPMADTRRYVLNLAAWLGARDLAIQAEYAGGIGLLTERSRPWRPTTRSWPIVALRLGSGECQFPRDANLNRRVGNGRKSVIWIRSHFTYGCLADPREINSPGRELSPQRHQQILSEARTVQPQRRAPLD